MTKIGEIFQQNRVKRGRRRRSDVENRRYICPCQNSYYSYSALWYHIHVKHKGKAPGKITKPYRDNSKKGRVRNQNELIAFRQDKQKQVEENSEIVLSKFALILYEDSQYKLFMNNPIKQLYENDLFYQTYLQFEPQSLNPKYSEGKDLFQENCQNVLCEFLTEINYQLNSNFYRGLAVIFVIMLVKGIIGKREGNLQSLQDQRASNLAKYSNYTYMKVFEKLRQNEVLRNLSCFKEEKMGKLMQLFYMWLAAKKYSTASVKINYEYFV